jgi:hypothetical protein
MITSVPDWQYVVTDWSNIAFSLPATGKTAKAFLSGQAWVFCATVLLSH